MSAAHRHYLFLPPDTSSHPAQNNPNPATWAIAAIKGACAASKAAAGRVGPLNPKFVPQDSVEPDICETGYR
jgi:hypothetical protein